MNTEQAIPTYPRTEQKFHRFISPRPSNSRSAILKDNGQVGIKNKSLNQKGKGDRKKTKVISPTCFHLTRMINGNDDISSEEHLAKFKNL